MTVPGYCIDNLEDALCLQAPVDVLAAACAKNFTATCKMRARELDGVTAGSFCSTHLNDPFCSCYTAAAPNWTTSCAGYKPKDFLESPDKRLQTVLEAIKVNQARINTEVAAQSAELDAAKKLAALSEAELNALNAELDALNALKAKLSSTIDEIAKLKDMLVKLSFGPKINNVDEGKTKYMEIKNRANLNLQYAPETQKAINNVIDATINYLEGRPNPPRSSSRSSNQSWNYIEEDKEYPIINSRIRDVDAQIQVKEQLRGPVVTRFQAALDVLIPLQNKIITRAAENAAIMAMLNAEKTDAEAVTDGGFPWLWIIIILLVVIASYVIYKFTRKPMEIIDS